MNYTLNSLHLGTEFDTKVQPLRIPALARLGNEPALSILDGANRAPRRLARLVKPVALLGLKVDTEDGVRVTVALQCDLQTTIIWNRVYSKPDEEPALENEFRHHRLVEVTAQGRTRGVVMLARRASDTGPVVQRLTFDVRASEIGDAGLLMVGFEEPGSLPEWAGGAHGLLETPLVGVCVTSIKLDPIDTDRIGPRLSGGRPTDGRVNVTRRPGFFVVNPGPAGEPVRLTLVPRVRLPHQRGRGARLVNRLKNLAGRGASAAAARQELPPVEVEVVTASGESVFQGSVSGTRSGYVVDLPPVPETVYVRVTPATAVPGLTGFKARVTVSN